MSEQEAAMANPPNIIVCPCGMVHDPRRSPCRAAPPPAHPFPIPSGTVSVSAPENLRITERAQALLAGDMRRYTRLISDEQLAPALAAFQRHRHLGDATALREALTVLLGEGP